ncbi:DUF6801 domain-containing protein [Saccharopolyspora erythraea]|uniref:DUF6801 domain-containing protein n=1 Tax=Saccharopolyspora erythraea TaxID=1836 RepID=A0ABP3NPE3_SACER|nr:DUF6801 domain-containing protein [Saccharopolyspora erythraea]EQD84479.1 hypothetical protein N599_19780 [Saccharopolyspora erythraea D]QRK92055.1 hypothetical protein JQX30_12285 [Saccharopolyspora erythraea]
MAVRAAALGLAAGVSAAGLSGVTAVAGTASRTTAGTCGFAHGTESVSGEVSAGFPESAAAGTAIRPDGLSVSLVLPASGVERLRAHGVTAVGGTVGVRIAVRRGDAGRDVSTVPVPVAATPLPASGELRLAVRPEFPAVAVDGPGEVVFELHGVTAVLNPQGQDSDVVCAPVPGEPAVLAAVRVAGAAGPGADPDPPPVPAAPAGLPVSYWIEDSVTRIAKLGSEMSIGRGRFEARTSLQKPYPVTGEVRLPSAQGYFVTFGFAPVTSTVEMVQGGETVGNLKGITFVNGDIVGEVDTTIQVVVRLHDVRVDGVALDVGPDCRTAAPAAIRVQGKLVFRNNPNGVPPTPFTTAYEIPPFTGCGVAEDLDPLLTGLISGPGNGLSGKLVLRCFNNQNCPPEEA